MHNFTGRITVSNIIWAQGKDLCFRHLVPISFIWSNYVTSCTVCFCCTTWLTQLAHHCWSRQGKVEEKNPSSWVHCICYSYLVVWVCCAGHLLLKASEATLSCQMNHGFTPATPASAQLTPKTHDKTVDFWKPSANQFERLSELSH